MPQCSSTYIPQIKTIGAISPADLHYSLCMDITKGNASLKPSGMIQYLLILMENLMWNNFLHFAVFGCITVSGKKKKNLKENYLLISFI